MKTKTNQKGTRDIPLIFAQHLSAVVNQEFQSGALAQQVSPVTQDLLRYWFGDSFCEQRHLNFHPGQRQAILNTIYVHEVLKANNTLEMYQQIASDTGQQIMDEAFITEVNKNKFCYPKYGIKMATGTGKTWVMNALLIWQYLNAHYGNTERFTKNFLIVAPGLIVYERLLDAFLGKENRQGERDFDTADLKQHADLFIPNIYRETVFSFVQNHVVRKEEIGQKIIGDGLIALTNWHVFMDRHPDNEEDEPLKSDNLNQLIKELSQDNKDANKIFRKIQNEIKNDLLPITPGVNAGHSLDALDNQFLGGGELEYLKNMKHLCVFNDEAHHIHDTASNKDDVRWQQALNTIAQNKGAHFIQVDFSATPYQQTGGEKNPVKHYFAHLVVDYSLNKAIRAGYVKTIVLDKRKEIASLANEEIDFRAQRDGKNVLALSDGQRLMLNAGLKRLKELEESFCMIDPQKYPKMLVMCEDTKVTPLVCDFLRQQGIAEEDFLQIDSDKKGSVPQSEWQEIKQRLFNMDKQASPKIVVSVLMLREGFDVSNICVIVPLRSSAAPILLEQVIGRGLRLMWREADYDEIKAENRHRLLDLKISPNGCYDILHIIEHPAFIKFYKDLEKGLIYEEKEDNQPLNVLGDLICVGLKDNYQNYDFYIPTILQDKEEILTPTELSAENFAPCAWNLEQLQEMFGKQKGEIFFAEEISSKTQFGEYVVADNIFNAQSYNEFLQKMIMALSQNIARLTTHSKKAFPTMQINLSALAQVVDSYIRQYLFRKPFDPLQGNNWRILMLHRGAIITNILKEVCKSVYELQHHVCVQEAVVVKHYFSAVPTLKMRENYALDITKSIYQKTAYPSNRGEFEKNFLLFCDRDALVSKIIKINEYYHTFAGLRYIRTDGLLATYYPDFLVQIEADIFVVETKSHKDMTDANVLQKQKGACDWIKKVNELAPDNRMNAIWHYCLLDQNTFEESVKKNARVQDMLRYAELNLNKINGKLL